MSRDFLVACGSPERAKVAERLLGDIYASDGTPLFEVDNRGADLFVMLTYPKDIETDAQYRVGSKVLAGFRDQVAFVALKNGEHDGIGYFVDSGRSLDPAAVPIPLTTIPALVEEAMLGKAA